MRHLPITVAVLTLPLAAAPASAQWAGFTNLEPPITAPIIAGDSVFSRGRDTPTMRRQRLHLAHALRAEVRDMLAANDGALSDHQIAYIRKRVQRINGNRTF